MAQLDLPSEKPIRKFRALNCEQKVKLGTWINDHRLSCSIHGPTKLARMASEELGFEISDSSVITFRNSVWPELRKKRPERPVDKVGYLERLVVDLVKRIERLETRMMD